MSEPIIQSFLQDFRYGVRILRKSPGFSAIAILSLALGIMAATAMYSVIYGVVQNPFPYRDVDSLMSVKIWSPDQSGYRLGYTVDQFLEIAERNTIFEGVIASTISDVLWSSQGEPQRLRGNVCTMNAFDVMGVTPSSAALLRQRMPCQVLHPSRFWATSSGIASSAPIPPCSGGRCFSTKPLEQLSG